MLIHGCRSKSLQTSLCIVDKTLRLLKSTPLCSFHTDKYQLNASLCPLSTCPPQFLVTRVFIQTKQGSNGLHCVHIVLRPLDLASTRDNQRHSSCLITVLLRKSLKKFAELCLLVYAGCESELNFSACIQKAATFLQSLYSTGLCRQTLSQGFAHTKTTLHHAGLETP